ncbi:hypothetical protein STENM36S_07777 [Streptomyces tendae]
MPLGVRSPPATGLIFPVFLLILYVVPRLGAGCGVVVAPPRSMATERFT